MRNSLFRKTIIISILGHLAMFNIFSFSFGRQIPAANYPDISFQGALLSGYDLISRPVFAIKDIKKVFLKKPQDFGIDKKKSDHLSLADYYYKPQASAPLTDNKTEFSPKQDLITYLAKKKESVVMFYPPLPYHFMLYFQNRQSAHIEITFKVNSSLGATSLEIKRKISSGNLEVDLLSMRYLSPYLFSQQKSFAPDSWHTVKIDLSPKND